MGYAIANELALNGAEVTLVSGPVNLSARHKNIQVVHVQTAEQMYDACHAVFPFCQGAILSAAVADYRVKDVSDTKLKKKAGEDTFTLELVKNKDILASLGAIKQPGQVLGGFSLETHNEIAYATEKLKKKNCDFIVLNSLQDKGAGFATDTNKISLLSSDTDEVQHFPLKNKNEVAEDIVNFMITKYFSPAQR